MSWSLSKVMKKVMKNHTCSLHIWRDGKSNLHGYRVGFLEKGTNCTKVFIS